MKKMIPGSSGTTIPGSMVAGDYILLEGSWKFGTVYDVTQIASVGFVQDKSTKEIYQSANSAATPLVMPFNNDVQVMEISNVPAKTCNDKISPVINIRNNGKNTLTSLTINYKVNEGTVNTFTWTGSLASLKKQAITLPEVSFTILPQNMLTVYSTNPNSVTDEYQKNDTLHFTIASAPISNNTIKLVLRTDNLPQETTWAITGSAGNVVASGGPYTVPNQLMQLNNTLPQADCYKFTIYDAGGNGICCANGTGVYEISSNGTIIKQGGQFGASETSEFEMENPVGISAQPGIISLNIYPNPMTGDTKVAFSLQGNSNVSVTLLSAQGQKVWSQVQGGLESGQHEISLDAAKLAPGVYILQLKTDSGTYARKVSVIR
jgi:hypothetical protein